MTKLGILTKLINNKYCKSMIAIFATIGIAVIGFYFLEMSSISFRTFLELIAGYGCFLSFGVVAISLFSKEEYVSGCVFIFYMLMYGLYLNCDFGASHTHISALGFSVATIPLIYMAYKKRKSKKRDGK